MSYDEILLNNYEFSWSHSQLTKQEQTEWNKIKVSLAARALVPFVKLIRLRFAKETTTDLSDFTRPLSLLRILRKKKRKTGFRSNPIDIF